MKNTKFQNKTHWLWILILLTSLGLTITACRANHQGGATNENPVIVVLHQDTQGMRTDASPSAVWIKTDEELVHFHAGLKALKIENASKPIPQIDFQQSRILLIEMGQKPTGGYSLEFVPEATFVADDIFHIGLQWTEPESESMVTQVLTSPTLLLTMEKGDYSSVEILDQHGKVLFDLETVD